ncbi:hypothetical protein ACLOJK_009080 [Asimina triloba]
MCNRLLLGKNFASSPLSNQISSPAPCEPPRSPASNLQTDLSLVGRSVVNGSPTSRALLDFIKRLPNRHNLNRSTSTSICSGWVEVSCSHDQSRVAALRLHSLAINGRIPMNLVGGLSALQVLNLSSNGLTGTFPIELTKLRNLTKLDLHSNHFFGPLPSDFSVWLGAAPFVGDEKTESIFERE